MADIALLLVEEFERRKRWEKGHGMGEEMDFHFLGSFALSAIGKKVGEELSLLKVVVAKEMKVARSHLEPRSPFGLAAFDGFFSA
ncbi:hypothetical protein COCNU_02G007480 [Cocos nucifera]|uniref:Uncharacterized protein n=1 Tax=Cocos nucifera TaxID=13894 RepID=A0A8K0HYF1_COCNU|nr:hypothetical protein COCNU_02G007480 [Cocos nucifera]